VAGVVDGVLARGHEPGGGRALGAGVLGEAREVLRAHEEPRVGARGRRGLRRRREAKNGEPGGDRAGGSDQGCKGHIVTPGVHASQAPRKWGACRQASARSDLASALGDVTLTRITVILSLPPLALARSTSFAAARSSFFSPRRISRI